MSENDNGVPHLERLRRGKAWIKLWCSHVVHGSTFFELDLAMRGFWFSILALAGDSHEPGVIGEGRPVSIGFTLQQLAVKLVTSVDDVRHGLDALAKVDKITINTNGVIRISNWSRYQSEYQRQKKYRKLEFKSQK